MKRVTAISETNKLSVHVWVRTLLT